ncbi:MAG: hypothetical protein WA609_05885 [Terriglobales bacterium]
MIDEQRAAQWNEDAGRALTQHYGKNNAYGKNDAIAHLAIIVLTLLADRAERERFCSRLSPASTPLELEAHD